MKMVFLDGRSMCRHGRLIFPSEDEPFNKVWQTWKACQILSKGLLEEAHSLAAKDFVVIEDCSEDALPASTTLTHHANAAEKCCQLGKDAFYSLLRGSLGALANKNVKPVVLVVDLFAHTGDLALAVLKEKFNPGMSLHLHFLGLHANQLEVHSLVLTCYFFVGVFVKNKEGKAILYLANVGQVDWAKQHHVEYVNNAFLTDEFKPLTPLPGPPDQLAMPGPTPPVLSLLGWGTGKAKETLKTPDKLLKAWWDGNFSTEFREMVESARQSHELDVKITDDSAGPQSKRRRVMETDATPASGGGQPDGADHGANATPEVADVTLDEMPTLCYEAKVAANPKLVLKVTIGEGVFLENQGDSDESIKAGVVLCGYYKGKFWSPDSSTNESPNEKSDVKFTLKSNSDHVMLNSKFVTLGEVIKLKRQVTPADGHVSYHELIDAPTPTDAAAFRLEPKKMAVYFKVTDFPASVKTETEDSPDKLMIPAAHLAGAVPSKVWEASALALLVWAVKWPAVAAKGLQPIRPMVVTAKQFTVKAKKAVMLAKPNA